MGEDPRADPGPVGEIIYLPLGLETSRDFPGGATVQSKLTLVCGHHEPIRTSRRKKKEGFYHDMKDCHGTSGVFLCASFLDKYQ